MQILPIKELRDANKISDLCNETNEPIFITKNGSGDMVIKRIKTYEEKPTIFEKDLAKLDDDLLNADAQSFGVETPRTPTTTQSREDLFASSAMTIQKNAARTKPISYVETALKSIGDLDRGAISIMKPDEKEKFFKTLDALIKTANKYTKDKIE